MTRADPEVRRMRPLQFTIRRSVSHTAWPSSLGEILTVLQAIREWENL